MVFNFVFVMTFITYHIHLLNSFTSLKYQKYLVFSFVYVMAIPSSFHLLNSFTNLKYQKYMVFNFVYVMTFIIILNSFANSITDLKYQKYLVFDFVYGMTSITVLNFFLLNSFANPIIRYLILCMV